MAAMNAQRKHKAEDIFLDALDLSASERPEFLTERCGDDAELLHEVRELLRAHAAQGILERPVDAVPEEAFPDDVFHEAATPERIGPYRVLQVLGEGGMGTVYEAEQAEPVRRRVALKVIKAGLNSRQVVGRFEAERQALAVMDHPNIARVLDAGTTRGGRPYFVMELVRGVPLTEYCDTRLLSTRDRLDLFVQVCRAVQHAHLKGVIHRDLKPSNILVTLHDDRPVPKVIDFGIAKAMGWRLADRTIVTHAGQLMGTPAYMSPEQAGVAGLDVDSRSDVYSLGVMLYELLVGAQPFDLGSVVEAAVEHVIRDKEPPLPSSRLTTLPGDDQQYIVDHRQSDVRSLKRQLKGDLDWVVMKAIEKDRRRRYDTANGLANDLERYLANETVAARPPSAGYRVRKFARRHRAGLAAATVAILALASGATAATVGLVRARTAEANAARDAETAQQVSAFMIEMFEVSDPGEARGNAVTAREILDQGARRIETELADQPAVKARLMHTMGEVYRKLGLYDEASQLFEQALEARRDLYPSGDPGLAQSINDLGEIRHLQGRYDQAEALYREAIEMRRRLLGESHLDLALSVNDLGLLHYERGELEESEALFREALAMRRALLPKEDEEVASSLNNLGGLLIAQGELAEAEEHLREAHRILQAEVGGDHPTATSALNNLGHVLFRQGKTAEAGEIMDEVLAIRRKVFGNEHPSVATSLNNLATVVNEQGDYERAEGLYREALAITRAVGGPEHPNAARASKNLASCLTRLGRYEEAESLFLDALAVFTEKLGDDHRLVASTRGQLAGLYEAWGRPDQAAAYREG
jgi:serine/threonine protein kinase/tetratricopeptide (TPR) repeat protein